MEFANGNEAKKQAIQDLWKVLAKKVQDDVVEFNAQSGSTCMARISSISRRSD